MPNEINNTTPILRLREFARWAQSNGLCKSEVNFEKQCSLCYRYITNNIKGKGNIGADILARVARVYPQLNLSWLCTGEGNMIIGSQPDFNTDYKQAYEGAMMQIEALNRIIKGI